LSALYIRCNRARVYLDEEEFIRGSFRLERGTLGELCENCGLDLATHGDLAHVCRRDVVRCIHCLTAYVIHQDEPVRGRN
jgi:hypothetical protein